MARLILCVLFLLTPIASAAGDVIHVGAEAPPFSLPDLFGRTISLDYFDSHPGVIVFWSTSSPQSMELLEDFRVYQEKWGREDLAIVAINADSGRSGAGLLNAVRDSADNIDIIFPVLLDGEHAALAAYGVRELPTAVVIDAGGRISSILRGSAPTHREELKESILVAMRGAGETATAAATGRGEEDATPAFGETSAGSCGISRARSCTHIDQRDPSASNPAVMAVRLCVCHGDAEAARIMLSAISKEDLPGLDLRFALAHMLLVKGSTANARRAFETLREHYPHESWGEWGLGIVALTEGDAEGALGHIRAARATGWTIPEIETAVLKYLEGYWRSNKAAPQEEQFLALFEELNSVRVCYKRLNQRG